MLAVGYPCPQLNLNYSFYFTTSHYPFLPSRWFGSRSARFYELAILGFSMSSEELSPNSHGNHEPVSRAAKISLLEALLLAVCFDISNVTVRTSV